MVFLWFVTLCSFFVKGLCGFANSLVFTTLLSFGNSIVQISPIILLLNFPSNLILVWKGRKAIDWKICLPLCAMVIVGMIPGVIFFKNADTSFVEAVFGLVVVVIALEMLIGKRKVKPAQQKRSKGLTLLGILSGFVCGFCNTGVLVGTYLTKVTDDNQAFKANACIVYFVADIIRGAMFIWMSILSLDILRQTLILFPIAMFGLWLGMKSSGIINETIAKKIVLVMLVISGLALTINNL